MLSNALNSVSNIRNKWVASFFMAVLFSSLIGFMSVRGLTTRGLFLLVIPSLFYFKQSFQFFKQLPDQEWVKLIVATMLLPVLALLISQLLRHDWLINAYDGPSRILISIFLLFYFIYIKINFSRVIGIAAPLTLVFTLLSVHLHPEVITQWSGRYATTFVDPNAFGAFTVIFTSFCLFNLDASLKSSKTWFFYQLIGLLVGLYLIMGSGTRGSWLAIPVVLSFWLYSNYSKISIKFFWVIILITVVTVAFINLFFPNISERFISGFYELLNWANHSKLDSSAGIRLSMWKISLQLFLHSPLYGYGDTGLRSFLNAPWINLDATQIAKDTMTCCGPHNELLANMLRSGVLGIISVFSLFLVPLCFFAKKLRSNQKNVRLAAQLGLVYVVTIAICSLSMEVFNLKYSATFYGLIISGLIGQIVSSNNPSTQQE